MPQCNRLLVLYFTLLLTSTLIKGKVAARKILQDGECDVRNSSSCPGVRVCAPVYNGDSVCVPPPVGGAVISLDEDTFPTPSLYFPLSTDQVESWPTATHSGTVDGAVLVSDPDFGSVFRCQRNRRLSDSIVLRNASFGETGAFTVNVWIKLAVEHLIVLDVQTGYIFSTSASSRFSPTEFNQIHLSLNYLHQQTLRAAVQDGNDVEAAPLEAVVDIADGNWHMITLSTVPATSESTPNGIRLFVDGEKVNQTDESGGDGIQLGGEVFLCSRFDSNRRFYFDGYITQLSIFATALSDQQIEELYSTTFQSVFRRDLRRRRRDDVMYVRGSEVDSGLAGQPEDLVVTNEDTPSGFNYSGYIEEEMELCDSHDSTCPRRSVCATVDIGLLDFLNGNLTLPLNSEFDGICVRRQSYLMAEDQEFILRPLAYFPLKDGRLDSWPLGNYRGYSVATEIEEIDGFGEVFTCNSANKSLIVLENVPYGEYGDFSINFWFRASNLSGNSFQYLLSHGDVIPTQNPWSQNQVQVLLAESDHTASGVLRAVVKDSNDDEGQAVFLDSDGAVGELFQKDEDSISEQLVQPTDGGWHMVTLVTRGYRRPGFALYLDSQLVGNVTAENLEMPPGGDALRPGGKIYLCGRNNAASNRYFDGQITELTFYDEELLPMQIRNHYERAIDLHPELQSSTD